MCTGLMDGKNQNYITKIDKEIKIAEKQKPQNVRPYEYEYPYNEGRYETHITYKYGEHATFDKYFEIRVTANDLSGYPDFYPEELHFAGIKNLIGWTLNTSRTINKTPLNPSGEKMMVIEEAQAPQPFTGPGGAVGPATNPWRGELTEKPRYIPGETITMPENKIIQYGVEEWNIHAKSGGVFPYGETEVIPVSSSKGTTSYIKTDEITYLDKPIYTLFNKDGKLEGFYQIEDTPQIRGGTDIIANVTGANNWRDKILRGEDAIFDINNDYFRNVKEYKDSLDKKKGTDTTEIVASRDRPMTMDLII